MRNEEIERVMNYLARRSGDYSKIDFEKQLDSVRKTLREVTERNRQLSRLLKEGKKRGRLIDIRLALLRWRLNADN